MISGFIDLSAHRTYQLNDQIACRAATNSCFNYQSFGDYFQEFVFKKRLENSDIKVKVAGSREYLANIYDPDGQQINSTNSCFSGFCVRRKQEILKHHCGFLQLLNGHF